MTSKRPQVYILCEDKNQYYFARKYFELLGIKNIPSSYAKRFKVFRNREACALVVIIDDDTRNRIQDLYDIYKPSKNENILIFSPKRNIESWFYFIDTGDINVEHNKDKNGKIRDYKSQYEYSKPTELAKKLKEEICLNGLPENAPASLRCACDELNRLKN